MRKIVNGTLTFLGVGSAFNVDSGQSNVIVEIDGKRLLIDAGTFLPFMLKDAKLDYSDIDAVYVSHLHADHVGGLEALALKRFFPHKFGGVPLPKLYGNERLIKDLWNKCLRGGLDTIENLRAELRNYFDIHTVRDNGYFVWQGVRFDLIQMTHVMAERTIMPSYGLQFELGGKRIFFSTDTQFAPNQIRAFWENADVIFQDCETTPFEFRSHVHAHYHELNKLDPAVKKKMYLYHFNEGDKPNARADGFKGWARKRREYKFHADVGKLSKAVGR